MYFKLKNILLRGQTHQFIFEKKRFFFGHNVLNNKLLSFLSDDFKHCNIQESEFYKSLVRDSNEKMVMDKVVRHVIKENILVPELALNNTKVVKTKAFCAVRRQANDIPPEFKVGRYSHKDNQLINENFGKLLKDADIRDSRDPLKREILDKPDEDVFFPWKMNILGLYLAQGLQDIRLPCDVSNKFRNSLLNNERKPYSPIEDDIIKNFMAETVGKCSNPFSELAVILGRSRDGIARRYKQHIRDGCPQRKGPFSNAETRIIMDVVLKRDRNAHRTECHFGQKFWKNLGKRLGRQPDIVRNRWNHRIAPTILMYEGGLLEVDFASILIGYCVENGIKYSKEANWSEISR